MASALKRKRGALEVEESSKRSRSIKEAQGSAPELDLSKVGWDAAFGPIQKYNGTTNGLNGEEAPGIRASNSPDAEDFQDLLERAQAKERRRAEKKKRRRQEGLNGSTGKTSDSVGGRTVSTWKTSDAIGGRMAALDPVFTEDDK
jgi:NET1-associated nuclear protein 1 (U3 small nucleolar RNA-associated protein 17)